MNLYPEDITTYFIKGDPNLPTESEIQDNTLFTKTIDNYKPGILKKTILSMEALEGSLDQYSFVLRTNLSSIYNYPKLLEFVKRLPAERCYAARPLFPSYEVPKEYSKIPFGWGAGFILSTDLVKTIIAEKETLYAKIDELPDDVLIGMLLHEKKVPIIPVPFIALTKREEWHAIKNAMPADVFHFRAKSHYLTRRLEDPYEDELYIASEIAKEFYPQITLKTNFQSQYPLEISLSTLYKFQEALPNPNCRHLYTLKHLAANCATSCEIGKNEFISTWAILQGLSESHESKKAHLAIFQERPSPCDLLLANKVSQEHCIQFCYATDCTALKPVDLGFISFRHETALEQLWPFTKKYIALLNCPPEVLEGFLAKHPEWKRFTTQDGFTVLESPQAA